MATQVQWRGGSTAEHSTFTGAAREVTVDTQKKTLVVHDGSTAGGEPLLREDQANLPTSVTNGISVPTANNVAISTNGTQRLLIEADGDINIDSGGVFYNAANNRLGIGINDPSTTLHVNGDGTFGSTIIKANGDINFASNYNGVLSKNSSYVYLGSTNNEVALWPNSGTNANPGLIVDSSNRVGIGTTSVDSAAKAVISNGGAEGIEFRAGSTAGVCEFLAYNRSGAAYTDLRYEAATHQFKIGGNEKARLTSDGKLLVGTSTARSNIREGTDNETPKIQFETAVNDYSDAGLSIINNSASGFGPVLWMGRSGGNSIGSNTTLAGIGGRLGTISFNGTDDYNFIQGATIVAHVDGAVSANDLPTRLVFSTTATGAGSPTERMIIHQDGTTQIFAVYAATTGAAANVHVDASGYLTRSTSSIKYKTSVETLEDQYADALLQCRPVWYRSLSEKDNPEWGWWGFIAEEVAEIDPRLVHWKTQEVTFDETGSAVTTDLETPEPEGVQYDRFVPHLLNLIKRQGEAITELQAEVAALKAQ